jgi:hypothetical protein
MKHISLQVLLKKNEKKLVRSFILNVRQCSLNNSKLGDNVDQIYPIKHEIKGTTDTDITKM